MMTETTGGVSITVLLPAGRLPLDLMQAVHRLAVEHGFGIYCSLSQNIRLINVPEAAAEQVKKDLASLGADFKAPGKFPLPRICIGRPHCNLGQVDTEALSQKIIERFGSRKVNKPRLKISIAGCPVGCSWSKNSDIAVMSTRAGYTVFAGGKGGQVPREGRRILVKATESEVLDAIGILLDFHEIKTKTKQRLYQLLADPEFPFDEV
jgi:sulfite reductase beta subunit-like hemoprotein